MAIDLRTLQKQKPIPDTVGQPAKQIPEDKIPSTDKAVHHHQDQNFDGMIDEKVDKSQVRPADTLPTGKKVNAAQQTSKPRGAKPKEGYTYFYSRKPDLGLFVDGGTRVKFDGNYYETNDQRIADYIRAHYGKTVVEITEEQVDQARTIDEVTDGKVETK
jgi:hypothetical protein